MICLGYIKCIHPVRKRIGDAQFPDSILVYKRGIDFVKKPRLNAAAALPRPLSVGEVSDKYSPPDGHSKVGASGCFVSTVNRLIFSGLILPAASFCFAEMMCVSSVRFSLTSKLQVPYLSAVAVYSLSSTTALTVAFASPFPETVGLGFFFKAKIDRHVQNRFRRRDRIHRKAHAYGGAFVAHILLYHM